MDNYRVNFGGEGIDYKNNFSECKDYFPILSELYELMASRGVAYCWHFFEPYVEFTWVSVDNVLDEVLTILSRKGITPTLIHKPSDGIIVDWYCKSDEEREFGYKTYALSAKMALLFWKFRAAIASGCGEKNHYMRRTHVLANQLAMNYQVESATLAQRSALAHLFWLHGHDKAVEIYEGMYREKYL